MTTDKFLHCLKQNYLFKCVGFSINILIYNACLCFNNKLKNVSIKFLVKATIAKYLVLCPAVKAVVI